MLFPTFQGTLTSVLPYSLWFSIFFSISIEDNYYYSHLEALTTEVYVDYSYFCFDYYQLRQALCKLM